MNWYLFEIIEMKEKKTLAYLFVSFNPSIFAIIWLAINRGIGLEERRPTRLSQIALYLEVCNPSLIIRCLKASKDREVINPIKFMELFF